MCSAEPRGGDCGTAVRSAPSSACGDSDAATTGGREGATGTLELGEGEATFVVVALFAAGAAAAVTGGCFRTGGSTVQRFPMMIKIERHVHEVTGGIPRNANETRS